MLKTLSFLAAACVLTASAHASTAAVNFDDQPTGSSFFSTAGPAQTITYPGIATFTGGVILGDASNLPGLGFATPPNAYGTAGIGDSSLQNLITISVDPSTTVNEVSFALLNGATIPSGYVVDAFNGSTLLGFQTFDLANNSDSGFALPDLLFPDITSVTIQSTTNDPVVNGWDFFIDSVAFNESIQQELSPTPEPSSLMLLGTGALGIIAAARRRLRPTTR